MAAGTPHRTKITYEWRLVDRVIAKIAYATLVCRLGIERVEKDSFKELREFVIGKAPDTYDPVRRISGIGAIKEFPRDHVVSIEQDEHGVLGIVAIFGSCYTVDFDGESPITKRYAAVSRRDGSKTYAADEELSARISLVLREHIKQANREQPLNM